MKNDNGNGRSIESVRLSLRKDFSKLVSAGVLSTDLKKFIKSGSNDSKGMLIGSSIPAAISAGGTALGLVTFCASGIASVIGNAIDPSFGQNAKFLSDIITSSQHFTRKMAANTLFAASLPLGVAAATKLKLASKTERYDNNRLYSEKEIEMLKEKEVELRFVEALTSKREDKSVEFAKEFLSNVVITGNNKHYNKELIQMLARHREALLMEMQGNGSKEETEERYLELVDFLRTSKKSDGASVEFLASEKIDQMIKEAYVPKLRKIKK